MRNLPVLDERAAFVDVGSERVLRTKQLALQRLARQLGQQLVPLAPITTTQSNQ